MRFMVTVVNTKGWPAKRMKHLIAHIPEIVENMKEDDLLIIC